MIYVAFSVLVLCITALTAGASWFLWTEGYKAFAGLVLFLGFIMLSMIQISSTTDD